MARTDFTMHAAAQPSESGCDYYENFIDGRDTPPAASRYFGAETATRSAP